MYWCVVIQAFNYGLLCWKLFLCVNIQTYTNPYICSWRSGIDIRVNIWQVVNSSCTLGYVVLITVII